MIHEGFQKNRLAPEANNPREVAFASAWKALNKGEVVPMEGTLVHLVPKPTERDAAVAATVIQWLGSNVGISFLVEVAKSSPEVRRALKL